MQCAQASQGVQAARGDCSVAQQAVGEAARQPPQVPSSVIQQLEVGGAGALQRRLDVIVQAAAGGRGRQAGKQRAGQAE